MLGKNTRCLFPCRDPWLQGMLHAGAASITIVLDPLSPLRLKVALMNGRWPSLPRPLHRPTRSTTSAPAIDANESPPICFLPSWSDSSLPNLISPPWILVRCRYGHRCQRAAPYLFPSFLIWFLPSQSDFSTVDPGPLLVCCLLQASFLLNLLVGRT
jgi:hypothetical protein